MTVIVLKYFVTILKIQTAFRITVYGLCVKTEKETSGSERKQVVLDRYNPETEKFTHWEIKSDLTEENSITAIYEDSKGKHLDWHL